MGRNKPPIEDEETPVDLPEEPQVILTEPRQGEIPVDPATGKPYKSGEIPPGWSEPVP